MYTSGVSCPEREISLRVQGSCRQLHLLSYSRQSSLTISLHPRFFLSLSLYLPVPSIHIFQFIYTEGLLYKLGDSNLQYVMSASFLLVTYAKYLTRAGKVVSCRGSSVPPNLLRRIAKRQVDYILGDNPLKMSFMVGYGSKFPERIHHRGSSLPSVRNHLSKIPCFQGFKSMNSAAPNPNLLVGTIVGGPDANDRFPDLRPDYSQSEPATYINALLIGALAYLAHSSGKH